MKLLVLIAALLAGCSAKSVEVFEYKEGDRYILFPDGDGVPHLVDLEEEVDATYIASLITRNADDNQYWLYTRKNPTTPDILRIWNVDSVVSSNFDPNLPVVVVAHGWNSNGNSEVNTLITEAYLAIGEYNVIVLDWNQLANRTYTTAKAGVAAVGRGLGQFLNFLVTVGASYDRMHLVGFSLGAHLVGNAANAANGQIQRVTGLDPAGPLWGSDNDRIQSHHARYVEIIHTSTTLGHDAPLGHTDYWPNGGTSMPGCWLFTCSHGMAPSYYASSVKYNHLLANKCETKTQAERDTCTGELFPMGNGDFNKTGSGYYRVNTQRNYPY